MESVNTPQKRDINILSNILLSDSILEDEVGKSSDIPNKENVDCKVPKAEQSPESSILFKNLAFELPIPKRKTSFSDGGTVKKLRTEPCNDADNEVKMFNYLTGTYESTKQTNMDELPEDCFGIKEDNKLSMAMVGGNESIRVVSSDPIEPLKFEVFDNAILNNTKGHQLNGNILEGILKGTPANSLLKTVLTSPVPQISSTKRLWEYKCKSCSCIATTKAELITHIHSAHSDVSCLFECRGLCGNKTVKILLWREKFDKAHAAMQYDIVLKCLDCGNVFHEKGDFELHIINCDLLGSGKKPSSLLFKLLVDSKSSPGEAIEILSDDDGDACLTGNEHNNQHEDHVVVLSDDSDSGINGNNVNEDDLDDNAQELSFQCFDCPYSNAGDLPQFKLHVARHAGSKFRCMQHHPDTKESDCAKCLYEKAVLGDNKQCPSLREARCGPGEIKCFHCPYVTSRRKYLYYHAVDHVLEGFSCKTHHASASSDACLECVYANCLETAQKDVLECEVCGFKTVIIAVFDVHQCATVASRYTCWDCALDSFKSIDELREHAVVHYKSEFRCNDHKSAVNCCSQCLYQALAASLDGSVFACDKCNFRSLCEETFSLHSAGGCSHSPSNKFKCFHCDYETDNKNLLKHHCKEHYDLTYACDSHTESPQLDCPRCTYQKLLSSSQKSLFACTKCNYKTFNGFHFNTHTDRYHATPTPFKCFDCTATFKSFRCLKYHALSHSDSKVKCPTHKPDPVPTCPKCIYEGIIDNLKEGGTFTCKKCGYKNYLWNHMKSHQCEAGAVALKPVQTFACFDCDFSHERLDFYKAHVQEHRASTFRCDEHNSIIADCPKCRYTRFVSATTKERLVCFDCDKRRLFADLLCLHKHVAKEHPKSNFACILHDDKKNDLCGQCSYQQVVKDVVGEDDYVQLMCWDCDGQLFSLAASYEEHIVYSHLGSEFTCPKHGAGKADERCSKCLYQKALQRHANEKLLTFKCFQCNYSTKQFHNFKRHAKSTHQRAPFKCNKHPERPASEDCPQCFYHRMKTDNPRASPFGRCYECKSDKARAPRRLVHLKNHIKKKHEKSSFVCTLHPNGGGTNCVKCLFEILARCVTRKTEYPPSSCDNPSCLARPQTYRKFKCEEHSLKDCSHCFYASTASGEVFICYACLETATFPTHNALREHLVNNHKTSTFICPSHTVKTVNCDKCLFQQRLEVIREEQHLSLHCFDCGYKTSKFSGLRFHVRKLHRDSKYHCEQHLTVKATTDCHQCWYTSVVENVQKFMCYGCKTCPAFSSIDTLKRHVYEVHEKDFFVCPDEHAKPDSGCAKCLFQNVVRDTFILQCHDCDVSDLFQSKDCLKKHIKEHHINSKFICILHPLGPQSGTCSRCVYEELLRVCLTEYTFDESRPGTSNELS